jgi:hypothetical protein
MSHGREAFTEFDCEQFDHPENIMNTSLWSAGRNTHLKIVVVSLIASIAVVAVGINAHLDREMTGTRVESADVVIKAGKPKLYTDIDQANIR